MQEKENLHQAQQNDLIVKELYRALQIKHLSPSWRQSPLQHYRQLWSQLQVVDDIVCRKFSPSPGSDVLLVPVLPSSHHRRALHCNHDTSTSGHQGFEKTLLCLKQEVYWVKMAKDVEDYCRQCTQCQKNKLPMPSRAPLTNIPIGQPWEMIAVDIPKVPLSSHNSRYLLVV